MSQSWKIHATSTRKRVQAALVAHEEATGWDPEIVLSGHEQSRDRPERWVLEAWLPRKPGARDRKAVAALFGKNAPKLAVEKVEAQDWVALSQEGLEPIRAGRFFVRTPDHRPAGQADMFDFVIPASQAFGTGHHETTAGCLAMLDRMKRRGVVARNIADIGTGTGLLAFAALHLWPRALATASDIDPVCVQVVEANAAANAVQLGAGPGTLTMAVADGMAAPLIQARAPYDLLIANILAGPLIELAADFADTVLPRGNLLLSGLLAEQEPGVRAAYRKAGFRLAARMVHGDWAILWLRRRNGATPHPSRPGKLPAWARGW